jgi:hypothetical protein
MDRYDGKLVRISLPFKIIGFNTYLFNILVDEINLKEKIALLTTVVFKVFNKYKRRIESCAFFVSCDSSTVCYKNLKSNVG